MAAEGTITSSLLWGLLSALILIGDLTCMNHVMVKPPLRHMQQIEHTGPSSSPHPPSQPPAPSPFPPPSTHTHAGISMNMYEGEWIHLNSFFRHCIMGNNVCNFLFASGLKTLPKMGHPWKKEFAPLEANSFLIELTFIDESGAKDVLIELLSFRAMFIYLS